LSVVLAGETEKACEYRGLCRRSALLGLLSLGAVGISACSRLVERYRYKLRLELEVDGCRYVGEGVREIVMRDQSAFPDQTNLLTQDTRGEAFWVDVPGKPTLFVILPGYNGAFTEAWNPNRYLTSTTWAKDGFGKRAASTRRDMASLSPADLPGLVYFRDIASSASGEILDPDDLEPAFGANARILGALVERTREPLTRGIQQKLPWFAAEIKKFRRNPTITQEPRRYTFSVTHFYSWGWL
jgi:hypothetical protein